LIYAECILSAHIGETNPSGGSSAGHNMNEILGSDFYRQSFHSSCVYCYPSKA